MYGDKKPESISRWRIAGKLRTESPLHIGDGRILAIKERACSWKFPPDVTPKYASVMTTREGRPVIPGSSLKGALHAWAKEHMAKVNQELVLETFGSEAHAGVIRFHDARCSKGDGPQADHPEYGFWCEGRSTALRPQTAIHPRTRSAEESLLYYVEYVPQDAEFDVCFTAQGGTNRHRALLLHILDKAFPSAGRPATLGSGAADGWGRVKWTPGAFEAMEGAQWLAGPLKPWSCSLAPVDRSTYEQWKVEALEFEAAARAETITLQLVLDFEGALLVNDPSREKRASAAVGEVSGGPVGHATIRTLQGERPFLPSSSVRGAFRAQARRIWQTIFHGEQSQDLDLADRDSQEVRRNGEQKQLAAFLKLFGAAGWRAPIEISDFKLTARGETHRQEFIAVDRFTGGVAGGKKFSAEGIWRPQFTGTVHIRTDRLFRRSTEAERRSAEAGPWVWLILAWTLRDWAEGDGTIGFGRSKGYGAFRASISKASGPEGDLLRQIVERDKAALESPQLQTWHRSLEELHLPPEAE